MSHSEPAVKEREQTTFIGLKIPIALLERVDRRAALEMSTRSAIIRRCIARSMTREKKGGA